MEVARRDARSYVREKPPLHGVIDLAWLPVALFGRCPAIVGINGTKEFGPLRKFRIRKCLWSADGRQRDRPILRFGQQLMKLNVKAKGGSLLSLRLMHEGGLRVHETHDLCSRGATIPSAGRHSECPGSDQGPLQRTSAELSIHVWRIMR